MVRERVIDNRINYLTNKQLLVDKWSILVSQEINTEHGLCSQQLKIDKNRTEKYGFFVALLFAMGGVSRYLTS